jgi:phage shock protein PspC (stress-responsive transcriptional regulator)
VIVVDVLALVVGIAVVAYLILAIVDPGRF